MFEGKKVRLREYSKDDLELARAYLNDMELRKLMTPGIPFPLRVEEELKWYDALTSMSDGPYNFAIESIEESQYIGGCGINHVDSKNRVGLVGIFLGKDHLNQGYGTEAMRLLVDFCFNEVNLNKVKLFVYSVNKRAIRCYEKVGFKQEGVLREEMYRDGKYQDNIIMGMLKSEWENSV